MKSAIYTAVNEGLARALRTPPYLILFVSDTCWMHCAHCWFNEEWKKEHLERRALGFDDYERMARSLGRVAFLSLTGGEAFQRPDIVELATMFRRTARVSRYQIPTSGYLTDRIVERTEAMLQKNPDTPFRVDVSLDGVGEIHNLQRRVRDGYSRACATITALRGLKARYAHFDVGVITTISNVNQHQVDEIGAEVERLNPDGEWMINITRGEPRDPQAIDVHPNMYRRADALIRERTEAGRMPGHGGHQTAKWLTAKNVARRQLILDIVEGRREGGGCSAGALAGVVYSDGEVHACEMLDDPLGNVQDFDGDLAALWRSPRAKALRAKIQRTKCQCTQECFLSTSMLIQPDTWPKMVRARLELAQGTRRGRPGVPSPSPG